jgi:hypothetical protein
MPAVKFFESLDLDPIGLFLDGHYLQSPSTRCAGRWPDIQRPSKAANLCFVENRIS